MSKSDLYFILLTAAIIANVSMNELGFGAITFVPLTLLACWLMLKAFEDTKSSEPDKADTPEDMQVSGMLMALILTVTRDRHYKPEGS